MIEQLEQVERMEAAGEIVVIRPQKPVVVDRIERDIKKLTELVARKDEWPGAKYYIDTEGVRHDLHYVRGVGVEGRCDCRRPR